MSLKQPISDPSFSGFENIKRYWDRRNGIVTAKILPGEYYVTDTDEMITTVLGSCISACIRDRVLCIGGMNHFMLPDTTEERLQDGVEAVVGVSTRYGNYAMEHLINTILVNGGKRENLEVKVFGGGKIIPTLTGIGLKNIGFVLDYIDTEGLPLIAQDLGDIFPRKVNYFPKTGKVKMKKIKELQNQSLVQREIRYRTEIKEATVESDVELF
jgi:chemotaxis protein CheD